MAKHGCERVFIVGGGFSHYAGLPLTGEFTSALLAASDPERGRSGALVSHLKEFAEFVFGPIAEDDWPPLEDLFTCIDLAANTGHHLGSKYSAAKLRTVRRCLIVRIIRMLHNRLKRAGKAGTAEQTEWKVFHDFLLEVDHRSSAFLSMNWDEVVESVALSVPSQKRPPIEYGCDAIQVEISEDELRMVPSRESQIAPVRIVKIHGSVNWLYCDNCRRCFWLAPGNGISISNQLLTDPEWKLVLPREHRTKRWTCPTCKEVLLSTRLATFSYRKALDFAVLQKSWSKAEDLLREARTWAFIGYSLPAADYEFKHFLKRIQLSRQSKPHVILVTGGPKAQANATRKSYQQFFGRRFENGVTCFMKGLTTESTRALLQC